MEAKISYLKNLIKRKCKIFFCQFNTINTNDILDKHKYLMKKYKTKQCLG